jgi:hypothetical protein
MMERPLRNLKVKRARNNFFSPLLRWNYASGNIFFGTDKPSAFLLGGLFIVVSADKKETGGTTVCPMDLGI